jgi:hypothetical protein
MFKVIQIYVNKKKKNVNFMLIYVNVEEKN